MIVASSTGQGRQELDQCFKLFGTNPPSLRNALETERYATDRLAHIYTSAPPVGYSPLSTYHFPQVCIRHRSPETGIEMGVHETTF